MCTVHQASVMEKCVRGFGHLESVLGVVVRAGGGEYDGVAYLVLGVGA